MAKKNNNKELNTIRDTIESIWVAIILAFVLRAFMVEAFVIPTGSMAEGLYGNHWQITCKSCNWEYAFGEVGMDPESRVANTHCPNCGLRKTVSYTKQSSTTNQVRSGDRVLVLKYIYQFSDPQPWDVIVFKNPQNNHDQYIKRLIGLPGQTIEIVHGDIFVGDSPDGPRRILRKPDRVQKVMWQVVHDFDYPSTIHSEKRGDSAKPLPPTWKADPNSRWTLNSHENQDPRQLSFNGGAEEETILLDAKREHFLPYYGYNTTHQPNFSPARDIISDLKLAVSFVPEDDDAEVTLALASFDQRFKAVMSADGNVQLHQCLVNKQGNTVWETKKQVTLDKTEPKQYRRLALTHVDFKATVWVDDKPVASIEYEPDLKLHRIRCDYYFRLDRLMNSGLSQDQITQVRAYFDKVKKENWFENTPEVSISGKGGKFNLQHISLMRDVYYTPSHVDGSKGSDAALGYESLYEYSEAFSEKPGIASRLKRYIAAPSEVHKAWNGWGITGFPISLKKNDNDPDLDEFYVLGDNSPNSLDGRGWVKASPTLRLFDKNGKPQYQLGTVPRYCLLGRAMFVYWPAGFNLPILNKLPLVPNWGRMRIVR